MGYFYFISFSYVIINFFILVSSFIQTLLIHKSVKCFGHWKLTGKIVLNAEWAILKKSKISFQGNWYIIAEGFFYIIIFRWLYLIFWFRTIRLSARVGAHIERRCSRSRGEDVTITDVIIKTPDRKWAGDVNDVMLESDGLRILGDFWKENQLVEIRRRALWGQMEQSA